MNINTDALNARLSKYFNDKDTRKRAAEDACKNQLRKAMQFVEVVREKLAAIQPLVKRVKNDRNFSSFFTDGWAHKPGFSKRVPQYFGCCGGGYAGKSLFVDVFSGRWTCCEWYTEADHLTDYHDMLDEFVEHHWNTDGVPGHAERMAEEVVDYIERFANVVNSL